MINTIEALQGLYVALGGEMSDVENFTTIPEMLTAISTVAQAAASELPAVKSTDNNKLLTVVNGKWDKADAPTELPAVTSDDNGNVLSVVEGAWAKSDAPAALPTVTADDNGSDLIVANSAWSKSYPLSIVAVAQGVQSDFPDCIKNLSASDRKNAFLEMVKQGKIIFQFSGDYYVPINWNTNGGDYRFNFYSIEIQTNIMVYDKITVIVGSTNKISCLLQDELYTMTPYS